MKKNKINILFTFIIIYSLFLGSIYLEAASLITKTTFNKMNESLTTFYNNFDENDKYLTDGPFTCSGDRIRCTGSSSIGTLSKREYEIIGSNSYLSAKNSNNKYWTNNTNGSNAYVVNINSIEEKPQTDSYGIRGSVYVKNETTFSGTGTRIDPYVLNTVPVDPNFIESLNVVWAKIYSRVSRFQDVIELPDGGYLAVGYTPPIGGGSTAVRYDTNGNVLWEKSYLFQSSFYHVLLMGEDKFIVYGISYSDEIDSQPTDYIPFPTIFIGNLSNGSQISIKKYLTDGGSLSVFGNLIKISDGYLMIGSVDLYGSDNCPIIAKLDSFGNKVWEKKYDVLNTEYNYGFHSAFETENNEYVVVGIKNNIGIIVKYDRNGNVIPSTFDSNIKGKSFSSIQRVNNKIIIRASGIDEDSMIILNNAWKYEKEVTIDEGDNILILNDLSYLSARLRRYDNNGNYLLWMNDIGTGYGFSGYKIIYSNDSKNIIAVGDSYNGYGQGRGATIVKLKVN